MPVDEEYTKRERLGNYLETKWREYAARVGRGASQAKWAKELHVSPGNLSFWINKTKFPTPENLMRLAMMFGPEVYDVVGVPREPVDDPRLRFIVNNWARLTKDEQTRVMQLINRLRQTEEREEHGPLQTA